MIHMGFFSFWVTLVMKCVRTMSYIVKCNASLTDVIILERGLR